ncbi:MAG: T9SS type A sorting domain-containing protein [Bacteroidota bacterium]
MNFKRIFLALFLSIFTFFSAIQAQEVMVTFQVDMNDYIASEGPITAGELHVTGSWTLDPMTNGWCGDCHDMVEGGTSGVYEASVMIAEEDTVEYLFIIGNFSILESFSPGNSCTSTIDGFTNRSLITGTDDIVLSSVCWNCCDPCGMSCSSTAMNECADPEASNYNPNADPAMDDGTNCLYLCDEDPSNLLTVTPSTGFDNGDGLSFGNASSMGLLPGANNSFGGFIWDAQTTGLNANDFCISIDYTVTGGDPSDYPMTLEFRIENNGATGSFPEPWNDFNLSVSGPGTYSLGGIVSAGTPSSAGSFDPSGVSPSIVAALANFDGSPIVDTVIVVFDNLCVSTNCGATPGCTDEAANNYNPDAVTDDGTCVYDFTFNVDMNCWDGDDADIESNAPYGGSFSAVSLESPNFGWCGGCVPLDDMDGDGIWSVTLNDMSLGDFEYKYAIDGFAGQEQLVDNANNQEMCAPITDFANFANREVTVTANGSISDTYGACSECELLDPTACIPENFIDPPTGLFADQTVANGQKTQLKFNHYSDASTACILKGTAIFSLIGTLEEILDPSNEILGQGQVLLQGPQIAGTNGFDNSVQLSPDQQFTLFNPATFPNGNTGTLLPGEHYKWQARCGCLINLSGGLAPSNVILSPWSDYDFFTNLGTAMQPTEEIENEQKVTEAEKAVKLFPNPNNGQFVVDFVNFDEGQINLIVRNLLGEVVFDTTYPNNAKHNQFQMDISGLSKGQYLLEVSQGQHFESQLIMLK